MEAINQIARVLELCAGTSLVFTGVSWFEDCRTATHYVVAGLVAVFGAAFFIDAFVALFG
jgi:type IV secretory pathway VirB2 component (pilin)